MTSLPPLWPGGVHPAALAFPEIVGEEFTALVEDIRANGLLNPIIIDEKNVLLDGRNRLRAWVELGNPATTIKRHIHPGDPLDLIVSSNIRRRHLTDTQLATLAFDLLPQYEARAEERQNKQGREVGRGRPSQKLEAPGPQAMQRAPQATDEAAAAAGTSGRTVRRVKRVADEAPDLVEPMRKGELTAKEAERIVRRRKTTKKAEDLRAEPMPLPPDKYAVIELDPPWSYEEQKLAAPGNRNAEDKYPTMTLAEIRNLPVNVLAAENCHLYLWTTANHIRHGWSLLEAWGFTYKSLLIWHKPHMGLGHYYRNQAEFVLFAVKGTLPLLRHDMPNVFTWEVERTHSKKPDGFYEMVEECSPSPRVRLFARSQREGWTSWGADL